MAKIKVKEGVFELVNENKYRVAVEGDGNSFEGLGSGASPYAILAEYDRRGGLVKLNGKKLETGCFYDFKAKKPRAKPVIAVKVKSKTKAGTVVEKTNGSNKGAGPAKKTTKKKDEEEADEDTDEEDTEETDEEETDEDEEEEEETDK